MLDNSIVRFAKELGLKTIVGILLGLIATILALKYFDIETVKMLVESVGIWGPLILITAKAIALIIAPINGTPMYILGAVAFGPLYGGFLLFIGDMLGAVVSFWLARVFGRRIVDVFFSEKEESFIPKILESMSTLRGMFIIHAVLITFPDIVNYVSGLSKTKFKRFILVHALFAFAFAFTMTFATNFMITLGSIGKGLMLGGSVVAFAIGIVFFKLYGKSLHMPK